MSPDDTQDEPQADDLDWSIESAPESAADATSDVTDDADGAVTLAMRRRVDPLPARPYPGALTSKKAKTFRQLMRHLASSDEVTATMVTILSSPSNPNFVAALRLACEYGYGKVPRAHVHSGPKGAPIRHQHEHVQVWKFGDVEIRF